MTNIYVGNLSYETSQEDLEAAFNEFGAVERVNIVNDRDTGQPRGFAFVEMTNPQRSIQRDCSAQRAQFAWPGPQRQRSSPA